MSYRNHEHLVAPARAARTGLGWLVLGCVVIVMVSYMGAVMFFEFVVTLIPGGGQELAGGANPVALLALLFGFVFWIIAMAVALPMVHRRELRPVLGLFVWPQFRAVFWAMLLLYGVLIILPPWDLLSDTVPNLPIARWLVLLPLGLLCILIQVTAEELIFRGYLQQQLAARFASPLIWMGVPSALFGLAHYDASMGSNAWLFVIWAGVFGLLMADLTARSGSLGPAIAVHLINNIFALLVISPADSMSGLALYSYTFSLQDEAAVLTLLPVDFALMLVAWLTARLALRA